MKSENQIPVEKSVVDEQPPVLKSWKNVYLLVLGNLIFWILLFTLFTMVFR